MRKKQTQNNKIYIRKRVEPKNDNQKKYLDSIFKNNITICVGYPGTGKTVIAAGVGINLLASGVVKKLIITRPVVEAGTERLGFLPGDIASKLFPFTLPIYDEMGHFATREEIKSWQDTGQIEVAPFAYLRGRTFLDSFIIADELQNASLEQIKLLLTRIGSNSKMVLTADPTQSDLPPHLRGGITHCMERLQDIAGVGLIELDAKEVVRHPLIEKMLERLK
jgi:phosphate starvation-inducible PhoH-like protein